MQRQKAFWLIACPLAISLVMADARVSAQQKPQEPTDVMMVSRSGIDLASMDRDADPCNDFYQFACGGWMTKHPQPPDQPRYGRFEELQERNNAILRDILEEAARSAKDADSTKIGDYYGRCFHHPPIDPKGLTPIKPDLDRIADVKSAADLPDLVAHFHTVGIGPFFSFGAAPDFKDSAQTIAIFGAGGLGLPDRDYYIKDDADTAKIRDAYVQHVARVLQLAGDTPDLAAAGARAILQIETSLAKGALDRVSRRTPANIYHKMSVEEAARLMPSFNLVAYMRAAEAPPVQTVNVTEPEFLKTADRVIASTPVGDLKTYMRWHVIHSQGDFLPKPFRDEEFAFYGKTLTGAEAQRPRWKRCVEATDSDLGELVGKVYVDRTFGAEGKARTVQMVQAIEKALDQDIQQIDWMSADTKQQAETKLRAVANKIGYPDRWRDYSTLQVVRHDALGNSERANLFEYRRQLAKIGKPIDKTEWLMTPPTVNAYYNPLENNINFPAGILQPPFFIKQADDAVNFGAAGAVVGHELTHGFDDQGRQFDAQGNLREWWTPADRKAFEDRATCVADQYSGYTSVGDVKLNGRLTLGENAADNGGLRLAWIALMEDLKTKPLRTADGFSPEQRFFVGWGQMWCENRTDAVARLHAKTNVHSPGRYRTNGVVSNFPEFQKAFSCKADAKMVNPKMCRVW